MISKEIKFGEKSKKILGKRVDQLANTVKVTLDQRGRNVVLDANLVPLPSPMM